MVIPGVVRRPPPAGPSTRRAGRTRCPKRRSPPSGPRSTEALASSASAPAPSCWPRPASSMAAPPPLTGCTPTPSPTSVSPPSPSTPTCSTSTTIPRFTAAGTASGIDVCLHLVRRDLGAEAANAVARRMVVPPHRDGGQAQFISAPVPTAAEDDPLQDLYGWIATHLDHPMTVDDLAARVAMSPAPFARRFGGPRAKPACVDHHPTPRVGPAPPRDDRPTGRGGGPPVRLRHRGRSAGPVPTRGGPGPHDLPATVSSASRPPETARSRRLAGMVRTMSFLPRVRHRPTSDDAPMLSVHCPTEARTVLLSSRRIVRLDVDSSRTVVVLRCWCGALVHTVLDRPRRTGSPDARTQVSGVRQPPGRARSARRPDAASARSSR